jgi:hypothetical protein
MSGRNRVRVLVVQHSVQRVLWAALLVLFASVVAHANSVTIADHHYVRVSGSGVMGRFSLTDSGAGRINGIGSGTLSFGAVTFITGGGSLSGIGLAAEATGVGSYKGGFGKSYLEDTESVSTIMPPIPEPGTLVLMGTGLLGLAFATRRKLIPRVEQGKNFTKSSMT